MGFFKALPKPPVQKVEAKVIEVESGGIGVMGAVGVVLIVAGVSWVVWEWWKIKNEERLAELNKSR